MLLLKLNKYLVNLEITVWIKNIKKSLIKSLMKSTENNATGVHFFRPLIKIPIEGVNCHPVGRFLQVSRGPFFWGGRSRPLWPPGNVPALDKQR